MDETISIIVPVYHAENYIIETMDCIRSQTYKQWKLLLVVDGPQEKDIPIIQEYFMNHQ